MKSNLNDLIAIAKADLIDAEDKRDKATAESNRLLNDLKQLEHTKTMRARARDLKRKIVEEKASTENLRHAYTFYCLAELLIANIHNIDTTDEIDA